MYKEEDKVRVFDKKGLYPGEMVIVSSDEEEEIFTVTGEVDGQQATLTVPRSNIMEEWETDKVVERYVEQNTIELDNVSENEQVEAYTEGNENDSVTVIADATVSGISGYISDNFSNVTDAEKYLKETFSYYSPNGIYKTADSYYIVIIG